MFTGLRVSDFKTRFSELFEDSEKTNIDLGKELHVSNQTVSAWKHGVRSPKLPTVQAIADYFDVKVEWLLGFDVEKKAARAKTPIIVPSSEQFVKLVHYMSTADYEMVMAAYDRAYKKMKEVEGEE